MESLQCADDEDAYTRKYGCGKEGGCCALPDRKKDHCGEGSRRKKESGGEPRRVRIPSFPVDDAELIVVGIYLIFVQAQANIIVPKVTGTAVQLRPAMVLIGLVVGFQVGGLLGFLLSVPVNPTGASRSAKGSVPSIGTDGDPNDCKEV